MMNKKNKIDILFFERPLVDLKRYAFRIAKKIKEMDGSFSMASISLELPDNMCNTYMDKHFLRKEIKNIDSFLKKYEVKIIIFTNPRIPDMEMILHAHKMGIKTVMIQEGVIFEGANINDVSATNMISSLKFIPKTISYFGILHRMCKYDSKSYFKLLCEIIKKKKNIVKIVAQYFCPYLIGDYVLMMGDYWKDYYINTMGYPSDRVKIMGDHDLDGFVVSQNSKERAICYIATILVEDGSRTRTEFKKFTDALNNVLDKDVKLYIKLHPRSDISLYSTFNRDNVEFIREGSLPSVTCYIGHRSTLLARALYESDNLLIWKFKGEKADFFEQFASDVLSTEQELKNAYKKMNIDTCTNKKREKISKVYWLNMDGSINTAAKMIIQYLNEGYIL